MKITKKLISLILAAVITLSGISAGAFVLPAEAAHTHVSASEKVKVKAAPSENGVLLCTCKSCGKEYKKTIYAPAAVSLKKSSYPYKGSAVRPIATVTDTKGNTLINGTDYYVKYLNNIEVGTATVKVTFKGKYSGTLTKTFRITHEHSYGGWKAVTTATTSASGSAERICSVCGNTAKKKVTAVKSAVLSKTSVNYTGKARTVTVTVKDKDGKTLKKGTDYTVSYSDNTKIGTAAVTVKLKGLYSGSLKKTFKIVPAGTVFTQVTPGSTEMLLKWTKKTAGVSGYQVMYSTDSSFSNNVHTVRFKSAKKTMGMIYDLSPKTVYYVRIRTYSTVNEKSVYSAWSAVKTVTTKAVTAHHIAGQIPTTPRVKSSYFKDVVIVGDSISLGLTYYENANNVLGDVQFLTAGSLGACNALWDVSDRSVHPRFNGVKMKLEKSIPLTKAKKVYIMLGMNDISYGLNYAFDHYKTLLNNIQKAAPDVMIYVESVTPRVNQGSNMSNPYLNNTNITKYNKMLSNYCRQKGWFFLNVAETMFDGNGYLKKNYCSDITTMGMHYTWPGCAAWAEYLYTHTA